MNFAQEKNGSSRLTGFGIVVLIHVLIIWALASGLARKVVEAVKGPIDVKVVEEVVKPPPPPEKVVPPPPDLKAPPPPFMPPPEVVVTAPPPPNAPVAMQSNTPPAQTDFRPQPPAVAPAPPAAPAPAGPRKAAGTCTKMPTPEIPSVQWTGTAHFRATFQVRGGKIAASDIQIAVIRGANDRKAQRALINAISSTLLEGYQCPGDALLEQEFVFNINE